MDTDRHADTREQKRRKRSQGGRQMIVVGKGHLVLTQAAIAKKGASK
jgi:uncharacterized protein YbaP (TraB family)